MRLVHWSSTLSTIVLEVNLLQNKHNDLIQASFGPENGKLAFETQCSLLQDKVGIIFHEIFYVPGSKPSIHERWWNNFDVYLLM